MKANVRQAAATGFAVIAFVAASWGSEAEEVGRDPEVRGVLSWSKGVWQYDRRYVATSGPLRVDRSCGFSARLEKGEVGVEVVGHLLRPPGGPLSGGRGPPAGARTGQAAWDSGSPADSPKRLMRNTLAFEIG